VENYSVNKITYEETKPFILHIHYAKRMPSISFAYGLFFKNELVGVVCYGSPPSQSLCKGIAGEEYKGKVLELNRLVLKYNIKNEASYLVGNSFKLLPKPKIVVSYADTSQNHTGYIYQATNFIYTGLSDKRTEWRMKDSNKHSKTICEKYSLDERKNNPDKFYVIDRPRKHRYIYIIGNKKDKKNILNKLKYPIFQYPKFKNINYKTNNNINTQFKLI
jgi:hypothetical protein|tara:strand:+ start:55 stop:711 length:657 start_codon:yes stop_codon:yes gene_type:complete